MKKLLLAALAVLTLGSCVKKDDFRFYGVTDFRMRGVSRIDITADVENLSKRNLFLSDAKMTLMDNGYPVAEILLSEPAVAAKKTRGEVTVVLYLKIVDPLRVMALPSKLQKGGQGLTVSGYAQGRVSMGRKKVYFDEPLSQILAKFGVDTRELSESV